MILSEKGSTFLHEQPLTKGLTEEESNLLLQILEEKEYLKEEIIVQKGQFSEDLYFLVQGAVTFAKPDVYDPSRRTTYLLRAPAIFGESTFLNPSPQPFDIHSHEYGTIIYFLNRPKLEENSLGKALFSQLLLNLVRSDLDGSRRLPLALNREYHEVGDGQKQHRSIEALKEEMMLKWLPKELSGKEREAIEALAEVKHLAAEEICVRQNDRIDSFYLLVEGQLNVLEEDAHGHRTMLQDILKAGDHFGENSLIAPLHSPYTIQAYNPSTVLVLTRRLLDQNANIPAVQKLLLSLAQYRSDTSSFIKKNYGEIPLSTGSANLTSTTESFDLSEFLRHHWALEGLNSEEIEEIKQIVKLKEYDKGEVILQSQSENRDLYIILLGEAVLFKEESELLNENIVEKLKPQDIFGEFGFVSGQSSPYSVQSISKSKVLQLPFHQLKEFASEKKVNAMNLLMNCSRLMQQRSERWKDKEEAMLYVKNQHLTQLKFYWILCVTGLILSYLGYFKEQNGILSLSITLLQLFVPVLLILFLLKDTLKNWGMNTRFLNRSLIQAFICIGLVGGVFELISQIADLSGYHFFSQNAWHKAFSAPVSSLFSYLLFVVVEEWLRRSVVVLSLQRGLEDRKGIWSALLSALLFLGYSAFYTPLFSLALFTKDFVLALLFLRAPNLFGVILIHFILGLFWASLGWYSL